MIDTHAHIHTNDFDDDRSAMLERARAAGVETIITVGTDLADSARAQSIAAASGVAYSIGIHPHEAAGAPPDIAAAFDDLVARGQERPRAIGEIGLDYFHNHSPRDVQRRVFLEQLRYARDRAYPAIFHQRDAFDDFVAVLREHGDRELRGVIHCFTGDVVAARTFVDEFGFALGIGGVATFKSAQNVRDAIVAVGLDHIVLETDCPYLAPVPHRGKRNEPAYMAATADLVAGLLATTRAEVERQTSMTARSLFDLRQP